MSSHSRAKGKIGKSSASSAKSAKSAKKQQSATPPKIPRTSLSDLVDRKPRLVEDEDFKLSTDQITTITSAAVTEFHRAVGMDQTPAPDHRNRVDQILRNVHASVPADAPESEQAEQFLLSSIIVALRPFWDQKA